MAREAFVTLATNDTYCKGAVVLAQSLRKHCTQKELAVLITPHVSPDCRTLLNFFFDQVICVNILDSEDETHLALLKRPELGITFTKLHCWSLTQYEKCVFMDADTLVLTNIDELFDRQELSAAPDAGWPDMFNSGVFVYQPSMETYMALIKLADEEGSFDGGDQGLLNTYFNQWRTSDSRKRLSFLYNMHSTATYTYSPAFARFGRDTKVVHFIGTVKPWHHSYNSETGSLEQVQGPGIHETAFLRQWWQISTEAMKLYRDSDQVYQSHSDKRDVLHPTLPCERIHPTCPDGLVNEEKKREAVWEKGVSTDDHQRWRFGNIDYTGVDSFDNIQARMDKLLVAPPKPTATVSTPGEASSTTVTPAATTSTNSSDSTNKNNNNNNNKSTPALKISKRSSENDPASVVKDPKTFSAVKKPSAAPAGVSFRPFVKSFKKPQPDLQKASEVKAKSQPVSRGHGTKPAPK